MQLVTLQFPYLTILWISAANSFLNDSVVKETPRARGDLESGGGEEGLLPTGCDQTYSAPADSSNDLLNAGRRTESNHPPACTWVGTKNNRKEYAKQESSDPLYSSPETPFLVAFHRGFDLPLTPNVTRLIYAYRHTSEILWTGSRP